MTYAIFSEEICNILHMRRKFDFSSESDLHRVLFMLPEKSERKTGL